MKTLITWFSRISEFIAGGLLAAIFGVFLLQIVLRYFFTPAGWTLELIGVMWVWAVFFGCAFIVREHDHVKFDIIYLSVNRRLRTIFALTAAAAIAIGLLYSLLPTADYINWMKLRKTMILRNPFTGLKIPMRDVFYVYLIFLVVVAARYAWLFIETMRNGPPKTELEVVVETLRTEEENKEGTS